jgi:hypothetical protein
MVMFGNALSRRRASGSPLDPGMDTMGGMDPMGGYGQPQQSLAAGPFAPPPSYGTPPIAGPAEDWIPNPSALDTDAGAALAEAIPPVKKPGFFDRDGMGLNLLGGISDSVLALNGMAPVYGPVVEQQRQRQFQSDQERKAQSRQDTIRREDRGWQVEDRDAKANAPDFFMSGRDRVKYDPRTGQSTTVYDGAEDFQTYATSLGLQPNTPEYARAMQDYVLKGSGPTALDGRLSMEGVRQGNRQALRSTPTYAQAHPAPKGTAARRGGGMGYNGPPRTLTAVIAPLLAKTAAGQPLNASEQQAMKYYRRPGGRGRGGAGGGAGGGGGGVPQVKSQADYQKLPSGAVYTAPDGSRRTKG